MQDFDDEPTIEIPRETMQQLVFARERQPAPGPGHHPSGPDRPTLNMRPLRLDPDDLSDGVPREISGLEKTRAIKVSKANPTVKAILAATFPQYAGRKISLVLGEQLATYSSSWDGGSRTVVRFYNLKTGGTVYAMGGAGQACPEGWILVEHSVFCGQDAGITIRARRVLDEATSSVAIDAILAGQTPTARHVVVDGLAGMNPEWGSRDRGNEVVTALDLAWLAVWTTATDLEKAQAKVAA